jgi:hypothetical protein
MRSDAAEAFLFAAAAMRKELSPCNRLREKPGGSPKRKKRQ